MEEPLIKRLGCVLYAILVTILNITRILLIWARLLIIKTFPNLVNKEKFVQNASRIKKQILLELSKATEVGR
jgi:hypothetical protein|tara:strand:+ start:1831 stop:2046 length:216 start_codon:yes stop_codon:yes gene_type:complete